MWRSRQRVGPWRGALERVMLEYALFHVRLDENREEDRLRGEALKTEVTDAEIALAQLTDEQIVERIEKEIRDNPAKYPLLTTYYLDEESSRAS